MDPFYQRRVRFAAALGAVGLGELFDAMPRYFQAHFWRKKIPDPALVFDPDVSADRKFRREVEAAFRGAAIDIDGPGGTSKVSVKDFFAVLAASMLVVRGTQQDALKLGPPEMQTFFRQAGPVLDRCYEKYFLPAMRALYEEPLAVLYAHSRIDTRLYTARIDAENNKRGKTESQVVVSVAEAQMRKLEIDGEPRPVYRVGWGGEIRGFGWASWTGEHWGQFRPPTTQTEWPVYAQSHALRQLRKRINLPQVVPYLDSWLSGSLRKPRIVQECGGGDLLVEMAIHNRRVGYLVVTPMKDPESGSGIVVVRTFKFLTMEHTPEAKLLKRKLQIERRDVEWLKLDDLRTFTRTDLKNDPVLRPLMEECGCGHLFELAEWEEDAFAPQPKPLAEEMKRYLRMAA
jgi:hypothetical protein